ncbi:MAG TPA: NADH-quinone oxidoreductase subunit J [Terriglobales bacterium]|nr:NADH-quinone oxidoreductase subunit J [Terriglobales bacterium]
MLHYILFFLFAALAVGGAVNLLAQRHPIASALSLIVVMGSLAGEYMLLGAEFVAAVQVIVYAGAIMVLFVFVIMLLNAGEEERSLKGSKVAIAIGVPAMLAGLIMAIWTLTRHNPANTPVGVGAMYGPAIAIADQLFRPFLLAFEITSVLILIAIMGAVVLARKEEQQ